MTRWLELLVSDVPVIDDADDSGIDWRLLRIERKAGFFSPHEKDLLADARAHRIHRDERTPDRCPIGRERLHDEQRNAVQVLVLAAHHDVANHAGQLHPITRRSLWR